MNVEGSNNSLWITHHRYEELNDELMSMTKIIISWMYDKYNEDTYHSDDTWVWWIYSLHDGRDILMMKIRMIDMYNIKYELDMGLEYSYFGKL